MNIQELIYNEYFNYSSARDKKATGINQRVPKFQPYSKIEVSSLIDSIVRVINSELAALYFKDRENK